MPKKTGDGDEELANLQVPSHCLPHEAQQQSSSTQQSATKTLADSTSSPKPSRLRDRIKPFPIPRNTPGYQAVLEDIERRRGREMRHTLRVAEAARKKQQYRSLALAALLAISLGLAFLLLSYRG
ncbi:hypothetical protein ABL78_3626 [Leptomonas seymouri]|uniref:Transmembrane protein n=1 Tax=Leptomonas seymouri TaxID=5684 RepID=A0A0N0P673_LEPSE|nr:hypothetical protein ABL78_3626 [Leptomonas seymouri]|eukprot:KPI87289.1 hypothetical protein ABL78_3626 [Leptomonas seymouri]